MSYITRIQIAGLRNLQSVSLSLSPRINFLYGENGSGKTSFLEAISLLGHGRSFRSHKTRSLIKHELPSLTTFAEVAGSELKHAIGVQKARSGDNLIRVNGQTVTSAAILAKHLPLQIIDSDSFQLIEGSATQRRRFLDWMVFHVKPEFIQPWQRLQRVIKQRNSLLRRDKITLSDLAPWDKEFTELSLSIHQLRESVFEDYLEAANDLIKAFSKEILSIQISYLPGWSRDKPLEALLKENFERDVKSGYTHIGPHRADLKFLIEGKPAVDVLSRGQEKSLIVALHIAQAKLYQEKTNNPCIFLIDDLMAELDSNNAARLASWLDHLNSQVFVTGVSKELLLSAWSGANEDEGNGVTSSTIEKMALFHVKQGNIETDIHN